MSLTITIGEDTFEVLETFKDGGKDSGYIVYDILADTPAPVLFIPAVDGVELEGE